VTNPSGDPTGRHVLLWSGLIGGLVGAAAADWQVAVETGQVLAGLVEYPADNAFFLYHARLWSLLCQASAVFLRLGASEIAISIGLSALMGMLSFQALAMAVYALGRHAVLAIGSTLVIFASRAAEHGVVYPIWLVSTIHTYGVFGLSWVALAAGLAAAGWYRAAGLLAGLAPAVHPSIAAWTGFLALAAAGWSLRDLAPGSRRAAPFVLAGGAVTAVSLAVQWWTMPVAQDIDAATAGRYVSAFVGFWDGHRQPVDVGHAGVKLNVVALALAALWLWRFREDVAPPARFLLRFIVLAAVASLGLAALSWVPPDRLPQLAVVLMPSRLLNLNALLSAAMLFGLIGASGRGRTGRLLAVVLAVGLLVSRSSSLWDVAGPTMRAVEMVDQVWLMVLVGSTLAVVALRGRPAGPPLGGRPALATAPLVVVYVAAAILSSAVAYARFRTLEHVFRDRTNDAVFFGAARAAGLIVSGGDAQLVQLRARRPVLIDAGALDTMMYAPASAPALDRVLRDVYGLDLFNPPAEARYGGRVPTRINRAVWEAYSLDRWRGIRRAFGVTDVITPGDWRLDLPSKVRGADWQLYVIPE
jgi:hypothetical protein